jgi:hypothetical protein
MTPRVVGAAGEIAPGTPQRGDIPLMKITALALALSFGLVSSMAAFAQTATPATPAKPAQTHAQTKTKLDCAKAENKAKDGCKAEKKAIDKKS